MKFIKFSIIMCIKDGEKYIDEQIQSIINQDFRNWELIIIDDCSKDSSLKIAKNYEKLDNRILVKKNPTILGVKTNFLKNSLFQKGEWIVFCDQDDIWELNKLSCLNCFIKENPGFNLFLHNGRYLVCDENQKFSGAFGELVCNCQKVYKTIPNLNFFNLIIRNKVIGCFVCVNKNFLRNFIQIIPKANIYHDHWVAIIASIYSDIFFINQDLIKYRRHGKTNTRRNKLFNKIIDRLLIIFSLVFNHLNLVIGRKLKL